jgi:hypothetical protein
MKNVALGILLIATLVFGGLYLQQTRKVRQAQASAAGWRQNVSELQSSLKAQESDAADAQIKEFLGDDNFVQFQAYEKSGSSTGSTPATAKAAYARWIGRSTLRPVS